MSRCALIAGNQTRETYLHNTATRYALLYLPNLDAGKTDMSFLIGSGCDDEDHSFIEGLNSRLAEVIIAPTHMPDDVRSFQEAFAAQLGMRMLARMRRSWRWRKQATESAMSINGHARKFYERAGFQPDDPRHQKALNKVLASCL